MAGLKELFVPGGKKFYDLFEQVTENIMRVQQEFATYLQAPEKQQRKKIPDHIEFLESKNDDTTHLLFVELGRNFITPFDREDIHYMASTFDDIVDNVWGTTKQLFYFDIQPTEATIQVGLKMNEFATLLNKVMTMLRKRQSMNEATAELEQMRAITVECDKIVNTATFAVADAVKDPVETIKITDHYTRL